MTLVQKHDDAVEPTLNASVLRQHARRHRRVPADAERAAAGRDAARALRHRRQPDPRGADAARGRRAGRARAEQGLSRLAEVSHDNLLDLMRTRIEIETIALRWSLEKGGVEWEADLLGAFHRLSRQTKIEPTAPEAISEAWSREHAAFHTALVAACGSPTLLAHPGAAVRAGRPLRGAVDHVERAAARRHRRAQAAHARGAQPRRRARRSSSTARTSPARSTRWRRRSPPAQRVTPRARHVAKTAK